MRCEILWNPPMMPKTKNGSEEPEPSPPHFFLTSFLDHETALNIISHLQVVIFHVWLCGPVAFNLAYHPFTTHLVSSRDAGRWVMHQVRLSETLTKMSSLQTSNYSIWSKLKTPGDISAQNSITTIISSLSSNLMTFICPGLV